MTCWFGSGGTLSRHSLSLPSKFGVGREMVGWVLLRRLWGRVLERHLGPGPCGKTVGGDADFRKMGSDPTRRVRNSICAKAAVRLSPAGRMDGHEELRQSWRLEVTNLQRSHGLQGQDFPWNWGQQAENGIQHHGEDEQMPRGSVAKVSAGLLHLFPETGCCSLETVVTVPSAGLRDLACRSAEGCGWPISRSLKTFLAPARAATCSGMKAGLPRCPAESPE